jgi:hypothetical protein
MATPVLIATAGAANSNSYCTVDEANTYMSSRLHIANWEEAGTSTKTKALIWATRLLDDAVGWTGYQAGTSQMLRWPRTLMFDTEGNPISPTIVPQFLKDATSEFALTLIGEDTTAETNRDLKGFKFLKVGPIEIKVDATTKKPILPRAVQLLIRDYCVGKSKNKTLVRI